VQNSRLPISLRVEVSLFVLSPDIEDRDEVEAANWAKKPHILLFSDLDETFFENCS
jgi:hypothetical protein